MSVMSGLDLCIRTNIEYTNERCNTPIHHSIKAIAMNLLRIVQEKKTLPRKIINYIEGISSMAKETGYSFYTLLDLWSEYICECCVGDGEDLDCAWGDFCDITRELDW